MQTKTSEHNIDSNSDLLTIKQAAVLLNVSQVSLRRWTNNGQLPCLRVGTHRARRFRHADLIAFMEKQSGQGAASNNTEEKVNHDENQTHIMLEGIAVKYGSHLASFYDDNAGRLKLAVPMLADGLKQGDICFLISTPETQETILSQLSQVGLDVDALIDKGELIVSDGMESVTKMLEFLRNQFLLATRSGSQSLRLVGDMSWALEKGWTTSELNSYELNYNNSLGHQYPIVSLCQYDVRDFSGENVLGALRCHEDTFQYPLERFLGSSPTKVMCVS